MKFDASTNPFDEYLIKAHMKLTTLLQRTQTEPLQEAQEEAMEELQTSLEELRVAQDEILQSRHYAEVLRHRYQSLFDMAPDGYLVTDINGILHNINQVACRMLGASVNYFQGKPLAVFVEASSRRSFRSLLLRLQQEDRENLEWEGTLRRRDNSIFVAAFSIASAPEESEKPGHSRMLRWTMRDVTQRNQVERVLKAQSAALTSTLSALAAHSDLEVFLQHILAVAAEQTGAFRVTLLLYDREQNTWVFRQRHESTPSNSMPFTKYGAPAAEAALKDELLHTRQSVVIENIRSDPRITDPAPWLEREIHTLLLAPLVLGDTVIGLLRLVGNTPRCYLEEEISLIRALAQQTALALHMGRLVEQEKQAAVLQERNRMAREIHDTLAQGFTGIAIQIEAAEDSLLEEPEQSRKHMRIARDLARRSLNEARRSVYALRPEILERRTIVGALGKLVEEMPEDTGIAIKFRCQGAVPPLPLDVEDDLLRITQEALTNVLKHAHARNVQVELTYEDNKASKNDKQDDELEEGELRLTITDDGIGFVTKPSPLTGSFGLIGIRERAERIGARLEIDSRVGQGTRIIVTLPFTPQAIVR